MPLSSKIIIVDNQEIIAAALQHIITKNFENTIVHKVCNFDELLILLSSITADLIILDMDIAGGESYGMIKLLRSKQEGVPILIFTGQNEKLHALPFMQQGANGFLPKITSQKEIAAAIRTVLSGKKYVTSLVQQQINENYFHASNREKTRSKELLTASEARVMSLLLEGKWTKEIAAELNLKLSTISTHKGRIFEKYQVTNLLELYKKINKH